MGKDDGSMKWSPAAVPRQSLVLETPYEAGLRYDDNPPEAPHEPTGNTDLILSLVFVIALVASMIAIFVFVGGNA